MKRDREWESLIDSNCFLLVWFLNFINAYAFHQNRNVLRTGNFLSHFFHCRCSSGVLHPAWKEQRCSAIAVSFSLTVRFFQLWNPRNSNHFRNLQLENQSLKDLAAGRELYLQEVELVPWAKSHNVPDLRGDTRAEPVVGRPLLPLHEDPALLVCCTLE